jgi:mannose-6-phosphate isomerase-like protein (cupin superfamily)
MTMTPVMIARDEGERFHFLGTLHTAKIIGEQTNGTLTAVEFLAPKNHAPLLHCHDAADELFYILDGELWLSCGEAEGVHGTGAMVWLPHGLAHTFQVRSETARVLCVSMPSGFERLVATLGEPTSSRTPPEPEDIDPAHVADICAQFGIEVLGPPPAPSTSPA